MPPDSQTSDFAQMDLESQEVLTHDTVVSVLNKRTHAEMEIPTSQPSVPAEESKKEEFNAAVDNTSGDFVLAEFDAFLADNILSPPTLPDSPVHTTDTKVPKTPMRAQQESPTSPYTF